MPAPPALQPRPITSAAESAGTLPALRSRFAAASNIPARYCTGYVSDIGIPPPYVPMEFAAWMEVFLGGRWYTFDPRNNDIRFGRILIAQGRDAADVPHTQVLGPGILWGFRVWAEEVGTVSGIFLGPPSLRRACLDKQSNEVNVKQLWELK
jgi:hypothetical protein